MIRECINVINESAWGISELGHIPVGKNPCGITTQVKQ
jgi:hypothetical protein